MADVGSAYVTLMPSMRGFAAQVNSQLSAMDTTSGGTAMGKRSAQGFAGGLASGGIIIGAASAVMTKAMSAVSGSIDRAVSRVDTMQNFPKVMVNLGYSAEDAARNIQTMSDGLEGLPTSLDTMVAMVQQLTPLSSSMDEATQIGLAFNNMMLAGGASTQQQQSALLQYTQALAKGKPELQDWRTLQQVMPGQLDQVAKALLGASAGSMDLYEAMKEGEVSMGDFNQAVLRLNTEGSNGFASFEQQAKDATQGIQTAMDNMATRTAKGVATIIDSIGSENISGAINYLSSGIGPIAKDIGGDFKAATEFVMGFSDQIKGVTDFLMKIAPIAVKAGGALMTFKAAKGIFNSLYSSAGKSAEKLSDMGDRLFYAGVKMEESGKRGARGVQTMGSAMSSLTPAKMLGIEAAITLATVAVTYGIERWQQYQKTQENIAKSTSGLEAEISGIQNTITSTAATVNEFTTVTKSASLSNDEFFESQAAHVDNIATMRQNLETNIVTLNSVQSAIEKYAGATDLTTHQQNELKAAVARVNQEFGTNYRVIDAANGVISDSQGNYDAAKAAAGEYKSAIFELIDAKKVELQREVLGEAYKEAYSAKIEAAKQYASAVNEAAEKQKEYDDAVARGASGTYLQGFAEDLANAQQKVSDAKKAMDSADASVDNISQSLGAAGEAASGATDAIVSKFSGTDFDVFLQNNTQNIATFAERAKEAGVSVETLGTLSTEQLATLANSFDGSSASIVASLSAMSMGIDAYNAQQLNDKRASVQLNDSQLVDAQGKVYTWNGTELLDKDGNACADATQLIDAQGHIVTWNSSTLKAIAGQVSVDGAASLTDIINKWNSWTPGTKTFSVQTSSGPQLPWGRGHATGALGLSLHASGAFITNGPTNIGVDRYGVMHIAGEAGHEVVEKHADGTTSVIPIENEKYLRPFADRIAEMNGPTKSVVTNNYHIRLAVDSSEGAKQITRELAQQIKMRDLMRG